MKASVIGIVIGREYSTRVKKKSFLLTTFLVPILFAAMCILPALIMVGMKEEAKSVAVIDNSSIILPKLVDSETVHFTDLSSTPLDSVKNSLERLGYDAVLRISPVDEQSKSVSAEVYSVKPLGMELTENLNSKINSGIQDYRIASYGIEGLEQIMQDVKSDVRVTSYTIGEDGKESVSESGVYMAVSMVLGIIIYMFIAMFGGMVMSSVIEEKSSRVVEVLVSSVKATELMFGKIIGIALVALTQFLLWIVLTVAIVSVAGAIAGPELTGGVDPMELATQMGGDQAAEVLSTAQSSDLGVIVSSLSHMNIGRILVCFVIFFVLGYMLYASLFAAVGSAVENEGDSNQLQMPLTIPILLGFFIAIYAFKAPDSSIVFWGSMIPFTSPIVMLARLPFGVPGWEIIVSIPLLALTFVFCAWFSAKIYRVGILMFGKKATWKDLWKWFRQN